jgi:transcriptional regulator with XRE-family HTH domain
VPTLSTGYPEVDELVDGLRVGDNVVLQAAGGADPGPFVRGFVRAAAGQRPVAYVQAAERSAVDLPADRDDPRLTVLDWRSAEGPDAARHELAALEDDLGPEALYVFDSLSALQERWGTDATLELFLYTCPRLYRHGPVALWVLDRDEHTGRFLARLRDITQVVVDLEPDGDRWRLTVVKADGRPPRVTGRSLRFELDGEALTGVTLQASPNEQVGTLIRAERIARELSQAELARAVGISPSALSQVERGVRGLSGERLTRVWERLGVPFGPAEARPPGYSVHRRGAQHPAELAAGATGSLIADDPDTTVWAVELEPGAGGSHPLFAVKRRELVIVTGGVVALQVGGTRETLHEGDVISLPEAAVTGWANPGPGVAHLLWIFTSP